MEATITAVRLLLGDLDPQWAQRLYSFVACANRLLNINISPLPTGKRG